MKTKVIAGFNYLVDLYDADGKLTESEYVHNLMPVEGLNHVLMAVLKSGGTFPHWYIGLFKGNYTPSPTDIMSTFPAGATELTEYAETVRQELLTGSVVSGACDNVLNKAEFTANAGVTAYGGFISTSATKGNSSGVLLSAVRFASPKVLSNGSVLRVTAGFVFASV